MTLFRFLKLFGIDVPARMAQLEARFEQRVEAAKDQVRQAAQTAAIVATLSALAALAAVSAVGVGLFALYRWVKVNYGQFYGFEAVDGALILSAIILFVGAFLAAKSWSTGGADLERVAESQAVADRTAASAQATALEGPPPPDLEGLSPPEQPLPEPATSAADLVGPLSVILSRLMKFPTTGNLVLDELLVVLRGSAKGAADEAVDGVVHAVRYGDRAKLVAVLGGAVLFGWLLARHRADHVQSN